MPKPIITSKLPKVGTTIFTEISALANQYKAINLGQGFPNYLMDERLINLVSNAMQNGNNQYVHSNGLPALREEIAEKVNELYQARVNADEEITITPGATYAIYTALTTIVEKGDEVIVFEPAYDSYIPNIEINGGVAIAIPLVFPNYSIDWNAVKAAISPKTKAIIINSPHNPTGNLLTASDFEALERLTNDTGIFIISDEVYEHLVFDDQKHISVLQYPQLYERSFVSFSFGKVYNCTGWKMGYSIAPASLTKEFRKVHQFNCFTCNSPVQFALAEFLKEKETYLQLGKQLQEKRDFLASAMEQTLFKPIPSSGSYFQLYSYAAISDETEYEFAVRLIKEFGVATIPVSAFYQQPQNNKVVRFCFSKTNDILQQAASKLIEVK